MKKSILNAAIVSVSVLSISTATNAQKGFYVGVQGAPQLSVMFNEDDVNKAGISTDYKAKSSYSFGVSGGYHFTERLGVGTEAMYSIAKQRYISGKQELTQQFNYVKVPVLFTYNSDPSSKVMFTAKAGPQVGVLLNAKVSDATNATLNGNVEDQYKNVVYGGMIGAGARMRLAKSIFLDAGLRFDGSFGTENKNHRNYVHGRTKTNDLNAGIDIGVKYFL